MAEISTIERIVETAVSRILENHLPSLRDDLVRTVLQEVAPEMERSSSGQGSQAGKHASLLGAIATIHAGVTQKEILRALLDNTVRYSGRCALFVIKSGMATGWQGRGFENSDEIKDFSLDLRGGVAAQVMQNRVAYQGAADDMDARFITHFRAPADGQVLVLPLLLKDKVSALVYADGGVNPGSALDVAALELVVLATSAWLEVISLRKQSHKESAPEISERSETVAAPPAVSPAIQDPFAAHSPAHAAARTIVAEAPAMAMAAAAPASGAAHVAAPAVPVVPGMSPDDQDTHRKAQRFARLLMDEIKLYNQIKVIEGRRSHDLYDRLKEDIEKSRATYQKRYGNTAAAGGDHFNQELIHVLAEDDISVLGVNYHP